MDSANVQLIHLHALQLYCQGICGKLEVRQSGPHLSGKAEIPITNIINFTIVVSWKCVHHIVFSAVAKT